MASILLAATAYRAEAGSFRVGINGASCAFPDISSAIAATDPGDIVYVEVGTYAERLVLQHTVRFRPAVAGCSSVDGSGNVLVDGAGLPPAASGGLLHISNGAGAHFVRFEFRNGQAQRGGIAAVSEDGELVLQDSTLRLGTATGADGGGCLLLEDSQLTMENGSMIVNCAALAGPGGGVRAIDSELVLTGPGAIGFLGAGNSASGDGGGVHATGSVITGQSFVMLENQSGNDGGAIYGDSSALDFDSCDFSYNQTVRGGGAFRLLGSGTTAELVNTSMFQNATTVSSGDSGGGAIYATGSVEIVLTESGIIENSSASRGGGIMVRDGADLFSTESIIEGNQANGVGGGIYAANNLGSVDLEDTLVTANSAGNLGGGIYSTFTPVSAVRTTFESNSATNAGGAAYLIAISGTVPMHNVRMIGNSTDGDGGAMYLSAVAVDFREVLSIPSACNTSSLGPGEHCAELSGNEAEERGGAVASSGGALTAEDAWIIGNTSGTTGGALWATDFVLTLDETVIENNQAATAGGAIHLEDDSTDIDTRMTMNGGRIASNETIQFANNLGGGGVQLDNADADFVDVVVQNNSALNGGGFLNARDQCAVSFTGGSISGNMSIDGSGGAFYLVSCSLLLDSTTVANNTAQLQGGGIQSQFRAVTARNVLIEGNVASRGGGAHLWLTPDSSFVNTRLIGNSATVAGGALFLLEAELSLRSLFTGADGCQPSAIGIDEYCTEIRGNSAVANGGGMYLQGRDFSHVASPRLYAEGVAFIDNHAGVAGAAFHVEDFTADEDLDGPVAELVNVLIKENSDSTLEVDAVRIGQDAVVLLDGVTLVANEGASLVADGDDFDLSVRNTVIWDNAAGPFASFSGSLSRSCTSIETAQAGSQFFGSGLNPQFVTTTRGPYRLDPTSSPLIDLCVDGPQWDLDGGLRPGRLAWDVGAFEVEPGELGPEVFASGFESTP